MRRSIAESIENTPRKTPAGENSSRCGGGNVFGINEESEESSEGPIALKGYPGEYDVAPSDGGDEETEGIEQ